MDNKDLIKTVGEIVLTTGLSSRTPIITGQNFKSIGDLGIIEGVSYDSYGIQYVGTDAVTPTDTNILAVIKGPQISEIWELGFSNGLRVQCTTNSVIMADSGFKKVEDIVPQEKMVGFYFNTSSNELSTMDIYCEFSKKTYSVIAESMHFFMTDTETLMIPYFDPGNDLLSFIVVHQ